MYWIEVIDILRKNKFDLNTFRNPVKLSLSLIKRIDGVNLISNDIQRTARFITLNKTCYNGLYRVNKNGIFNVPIGRYKNPIICDSANLRNISIMLNHSNTNLQVSDYRNILLEKTDKDDFIYLDPPYYPISVTSFL
jgi:DNA adenine methylase